MWFTVNSSPRQSKLELVPISDRRRWAERSIERAKVYNPSSHGCKECVLCFACVPSHKGIFFDAQFQAR